MFQFLRAKELQPSDQEVDPQSHYWQSFSAIITSLALPNIEPSHAPHMDNTITITMSLSLKTALDELTKTEGISADSLISKALEDYIFIHKFRALRSRLIQKVQTPYTDEDIFETIS